MWVNVYRVIYEVWFALLNCMAHPIGESMRRGGRGD